MGNCFTTDKERVKQFYTNNMAEIKSMYKKTSKLFNIEFDSHTLSEMIDMYCGIDYFLLSDKKMYGVAGRINFNKNHHNHVTIRYKRANGTLTEFEKRIKSIKNKESEIYATITMQIDAIENTIYKAIIFESDKLYLHIYNNLNYYIKNNMKINHYDGNMFLKISYKEIKNISQQNNFRVHIYKTNMCDR